MQGEYVRLYVDLHKGCSIAQVAGEGEDTEWESQKHGTVEYWRDTAGGVKRSFPLAGLFPVGSFQFSFGEARVRPEAKTHTKTAMGRIGRYPRGVNKHFR